MIHSLISDGPGGTPHSGRRLGRWFSDSVFSLQRVLLKIRAMSRMLRVYAQRRNELLLHNMFNEGRKKSFSLAILGEALKPREAKSKKMRKF